jgi:putative endonuclease
MNAAASRRRATPPRPERRKAERRGRFAEFLCRWHLRLRGWHIVASHWRCPSGEIDILARRGRVLAIIEVKLRRDLATAAESVLPRQRRRIARAASAFLMTRPDLAALTLRFDVMLVAPPRPPRHLAGMWRSDD